MGGLNVALGYVAGVMTILSPCVLPLVPVVLGGAAQEDRRGPWALAAGLVVSFTLAGFAVATAGAAIGLDPETLRLFGAAMLVLFGIALLVPAAQRVAERVASPVARWAGQRQSGLERHGLAGQAAIGALLGLVWSPCIGPTLGAATVLAAQGRSLGAVAAVMFAFGLGIASILLVIAFAGRTLIARMRGRLSSAGVGARRILGALLVLTGVFVASGLDRVAEAALVSISPDWLVTWSTRF